MKKIIFLLAFSAVFFAGCGKQTETAENSVPEPSASETETVTETETTATETETTAKVTETTVQTTAKPTETTVSETVQTTVQTVVTEETVISAEVPDEQQNTETVIAEEQPEVQFNVIIDDAVEVVPNDNTVLEQDYDPVLHELGIDIVLTGTPQEQAIQYGEALHSVFGDHINYGEHSCGLLTNEELSDEYYFMEDHGKSLYDEWLAGRNWQDLSDQELMEHLELIENNNPDIYKYLSNKYSRTFGEGTGAHFL